MVLGLVAHAPTAAQLRKAEFIFRNLEFPFCLYLLSLTFLVTLIRLAEACGAMLSARPSSSARVHTGAANT
jgi:hypothetical protein